LKPWLKKIELILALAKRETLKQLQGFIGMVNSYRTMWHHRAHTMAPLTKLVKVECSQFKKQHWGPEQDDPFETVKALIAQEVLPRYPDPNLPFDIEMDASKYQLGAIIKQANQTLAFYSRKLTATHQLKYSTIEKELLSILEVLEAFALCSGALKYASTPITES
jgi:hypothetical protein